MNNKLLLLGMKLFDLPMEQTQTNTQETEEIELNKSFLLRRSILTLVQFQLETG